MLKQKYRQSHDLDSYSDLQLVNGLFAGDSLVIEYFMCRKCRSIFDYILFSVFNNHINPDELISELFLYLSSNDWAKLRLFDYRSKLTTWVSIVAVRFFLKKRDELIETHQISPLITKEQGFNPGAKIDRRMDLMAALNRMPNARYRKVLIDLNLKDRAPETVAREMKITIDNLYNIHRRAQAQLAIVMQRKEDYYE